MNHKLTPIALAVILVLTAGGPALASLCDFADIAIFAINSAHVSKDASVSGDVVANTESPGPVLDAGAEVALDRSATVDGNVSGHTIHLDSQANIVGATTCIEPTGALNACDTIAPPPYTDVPAFQQAVVRPVPAPGDRCSESQDQVCVVDGDCPTGETCEAAPQGIGEDVTVGVGETATLPEGDYGDIVVDGSKANPPTLTFSGGLYNIRSLTGIQTTGGKCTMAAPCRFIEFASATDLRVAGRWDSSSESVVGPASSSITAGDIVIYVAGVNGGSGPLGSPFAANIGKNSTVEVNVYAANGTVEIDQASIAKGAFLGLDVEIQKDVEVTLDSYFVNQAPTAFAQNVDTDGANDLVITLEGSDPEGEDLSFSIEVDPANGTITSGPTAITPAQVQQCSQSGDPCTVSTQCPGFAEGETCETVQPPVTQAMVTYSPTAVSCETVFSCSVTTETTCTSGGGECPAGETCVQGGTTCPEDFFTFGVTDPCGALGTAIVGVNGGTSELPGDPGICSDSGTECFVDEDCPGSETCLLDGVAAVTANDRQVDVVVDEVRTITLSGGAQGVASVTFRVESLPAGTLTDSGSHEIAAIDLPWDLPSPVLTYEAPATTQATSFTFSVRDSSTTGSPCGSPECDTATVNIDVGAAPMLAGLDQSHELDLNSTTIFNLAGNSGGAGTPPSPLPATGGALRLTSGNGPPMAASQMSRLGAMTGRGSSAPTRLSPTALGVDQGWQQFGWCDVATSPTCSGALPDLVNEAPATEGPFTFTTTVESCLKVTDTLAKGDHWRVEEHTDAPTIIDLIGFTREVPQSQTGTQPGTPAGADAAFLDPEYSSGEFELGIDDYTIQLTTIPPDSFAWGTAGFLRVDSGRCDQMLWTITALPTAGTVTTLAGGPVTVGQTFLQAPTLVYNSVGAVAATTYSLEYTVAQAGLFDDASIFFDVLVDACAKVGRPAGCTLPGGGGSFQAPPESSVSESDDGVDGARGRVPNLRVIVEGDGAGVVTSSRRETQRGSFVGLSCDEECGMDFPDGSAVVLYARPIGDDSEFIRWGGDCSGSEPITTIFVSGKQQCTAEFGRN